MANERVMEIYYKELEEVAAREAQIQGCSTKRILDIFLSEEISEEWLDAIERTLKLDDEIKFMLGVN